MKDKIIQGLILLCVMIGTIVIFHLIFDEHTKLFYINVITTCICELILLANIPILSNARLLTFKNEAVSTILDIYAVVLFLWTVIYSLLIETEDDFDILYIGMIAVSVVFIVAFGMVSVGGNVMSDEGKRQKSLSAYRKDFHQSLDNYYLSVQSIMTLDKSIWKDETLRSIKIVLDKMTSIPSVKLDRNENFISEANGRLEDIKNLLQELSHDGCETESVRSQITNRIEQLNNYVTAIKTSL